MVIRDSLTLKCFLQRKRRTKICQSISHEACWGIIQLKQIIEIFRDSLWYLGTGFGQIRSAVSLG